MGAVNTIGLFTLVKKEVGRFLNVYMQTIIAPLVTLLLYFLVFAVAFGESAPMTGIWDKMKYLSFLGPGLLMMTMTQNAFANTSSSLVIAKVQGNIVDLLMPPLSPFELVAGMLAGSVIRAFIIGILGSICLYVFAGVSVQHIGWVVAFGLMGALMLASLGILAGLWAEKFDHVASVTNFIVTPLTFLSGTFYSIERLTPVWQDLAHINPFFFIIDGFRYGFLGVSDAPPMLGIAVLSGITLFLAVLCWLMVKTGYRIKA
ncbi:MAG: multidrug ABC transporter permease [Alphaproteobacteria bacterium]|nr:multidrug ABC transporter permease [Alphaproteobacteria bacterium]